MSEEIIPEVFLSEVFGELRTTEIEDKTYFCGIDVARALGYSNPRDAVGRHCKSMLRLRIKHTEIALLNR